MGLDHRASRIRDHLVQKETRVNPSLEGIRALMRALGEAQRSYPAIQVTGTNGKTSSARMAAAVVEAEGLKTGLYTSPHLTRFTERITVAGNEIPEEVFYRELGRIIAVAEALGLGDLTGFELFLSPFAG